MTPTRTPAEVSADFLADLTQANRAQRAPAHTCRVYATDLKQFAAWRQGALAALTPGILRDYFMTVTDLRPATRARKQAAVASFLTWVYRQELIEVNPMGRVERIKRDPPARRALDRAQVETILARLPATQRRDRLLFRLLFETGLRVSEALAL
jgi:integrase/recombinase XerD